MLLVAGILTLVALFLWAVDNATYDGAVDLTIPVRAALLLATLLIGLHYAMHL